MCAPVKPPFALEDARQIDFVIVADSTAELQAFQDEFYGYAGTADSLEEERRFLGRLEKAREIAGPGVRVATHEVGMVSRLRAVTL